MLVGDSIMRNQWESLVCLVQGVVPTARKTVTYSGPSMAFHALVINQLNFYLFQKITLRPLYIIYIIIAYTVIKS